LLTWGFLFVVACGDKTQETPTDAGDGDATAGDDGVGDAGVDAGVDDAGGDDAGGDDAGGDDGGGDHGGGDGGDSGPLIFVAVTFNTGIHPSVGSDGFTAQMNQYLDDYYGHGLVWGPAVDEARAFFDGVHPDVVAMQEFFDLEDCADVPAEAREGFVCENWTPDSPTLTELVLGPGYQLACNLQKSDKCVAVKRAFGTIRGCSADTCLDGLYGSRIDGCGSGARIGRGVIDLAAGGTITLVNVHGSSGVSAEDVDCRVQQVEQVFIDLGDGEPGANGQRNLILGDFNTDPRSTVAVLGDASARRWNDFVGSDQPFDFINEHVATYRNMFCIDNMVSEVLTGECWYPGHDGHPPVSPDDNFDHTPTVCNITLP
jgi:hypothetical protein